MLVDFNTLPETSRVWIYQANRSFTESELEEISLKLNTFIENWTSHGSDLQSGYEFKYKRFIIIGLIFFEKIDFFDFFQHFSPPKIRFFVIFH